MDANDVWTCTLHIDARSRRVCVLQTDGIAQKQDRLMSLEAEEADQVCSIEDVFRALRHQTQLLSHLPVLTWRNMTDSRILC